MIVGCIPFFPAMTLEFLITFTVKTIAVVFRTLLPSKRMQKRRSHPKKDRMRKVFPIDESEL